ncbi:membrane protein insertion efficiency factor YidD [Naasia sp. SYSU D00948]|uniref:membrane protein insertion efficiency factor YidD n=1 Tax=Naasia sp. SYSU D00948 TaxID=2817379 RepID=UPI001B3178DB
MYALSALLLLPRNAVVALLIAYRAVISPLYGEVCRYYPSCSRYGLEAVQEHGVVVGAAMTAARILRCNPWSKGGVDDVPRRRVRRYRVTRAGFVVPLPSGGASVLAVNGKA